MSNEAAERLYSAFSPHWTIETGRVENPDGTVTVQSVTVKATVEAILAAERRATVERIRAALHERNRKAGDLGDDYWYADMLAILDAEAAR